MIFVDDATAPVIIGTGSEDDFLGSWDFGGRTHAEPFAHRQYGAPLIQSDERMGGRYCCHRLHGDNPATFTRYLKHTMEHGHANWLVTRGAWSTTCSKRRSPGGPGGGGGEPAFGPDTGDVRGRRGREGHRSLSGACGHCAGGGGCAAPE